MKQVLKKIAARMTAFLNSLGEDFDMGFVDYRTAFYADMTGFEQNEDALFA